MRIRRLAVFIAIIQFMLVVAHFLLYETWAFSPSGQSYGSAWLAAIIGVLSISFVAASLLAFRYTNAWVRVAYRISAVWLGFLTFLFSGAALCWIIFAAAQLFGQQVSFHLMVKGLFAAAIVAGIYGLVNASWTRVTRTTVRLQNLPDAWRGRKAALISDVHLGHVRGGNFLRRIVTKILKEEPDAVFIAGDLFDGTAIDPHEATAPLAGLTAPKGVYFVAGNHEQFGDDSKYLHAIAASGLRVLRNEKLEIDGLQIVGVPYRNATQHSHLASALEAASLDRERASILLTHAPDYPEVAEAAGISLQLSGHTHLGQFVPWSWLARRVYRRFVYGLNRIGDLQVFTSSGAGTWGPPLRLGSNAEIVLLELQ